MSSKVFFFYLVNVNNNSKLITHRSEFLGGFCLTSSILIYIKTISGYNQIPIKISQKKGGKAKKKEPAKSFTDLN